MTISRNLKKELTQTFPGIKFSVTTHRRYVSVSWVMEIGTNATLANVKDIAKKHETVEHYGDSMYDTAWSTGYSVELSPTYTQERKDWAKEATEAKKYSDAKWNDTWKRFDNTETGKEDYWATKQYHKYLQNGVATAFIDEYGSEPYEKTRYYEDLKKQTETETETFKPEQEKVLDTEEIITPSNIYSLAEPIYIKGKFPTLNKQDWLEEYLNQTESNIVRVQISEIIELTPVDYETFTHSLLEHREWLDDKGGNNSTYETKYDDMISLRNDEEEYKKWLNEIYTIAVVVTNGSDYVLVDPQGYSYARYVGFGVNTTLDDILNTIKPETETSNLIQFPIATPEPQEQLQEQVLTVQDDFYTQAYKNWVDKLITKGEYTKIKSFDDWYSIAKDVI